MNVPLVRNDVIPNFRSVSPPTRNNKIARERSPQPQTYISSQENLSKNPIVGTSTTNPIQKPTQIESDAFKVYVRVRPLNTKELASNTSKRLSTVEVRDNMVFVFDPDSNLESSSKKEKVFVFDNVYDENNHTESIYKETLTPALQNMVQGFNSTILAYGMTGAGKTFTMFGDIYNSEGGIRIYPGIVNLIVQDIFKVFISECQNFEFNLKMSYIEIYNEQIRDLLVPSAESLMIVEDPVKGIMIPNLSEFTIENEQELLKLILTGNARRVMASTHANQFSSRSHAIIQLFVEKRDRVRNVQETYTQSKLCFVDLAGSERAATTENRGLRLTEGANINKSLLALGNCINVLSDSNKKGVFVPFRDSKLTRLLKDSLGGNTRTVMLACVSPSSIAYEETVNTLNYASRARKIRKKVMSNVKEVELHVSQYKEIIGSLRNEIELLKNQLQERSQNGDIIYKGIEPSRDPQNLGKEIEESSLDNLGKLLFTNLEENWEIKQSLKELRELKGQNEVNLALKKEEQLRAGDSLELYEKLEKEITALNEVMTNNEKIEAEMQANLDKNVQEKKQIEEKMLVASSQYTTLVNAAKCYDGLEKTLSNPHTEKNTLNEKISLGKEFIDLHKEKAEKDTKIHELEQEISKMKRELAEKDKLLALNQQGPQVNKLTTTNLYGNNKMSKTVYNYKGLSGPNSQSSKGIHGGLGFGANRDFMKELKAKKVEKESSLQDLDAKFLSKKEDGKETHNTEGEEIIEEKKREETPKKLGDTFKGKNEINIQQNEGSRNSRFKGFNEQGKTAAHTIRQIVKNKYNQATQPVSVEELKNYAEKLNRLNFEAVQKKPKKKASRAYASPNHNPNPSSSSSYASQFQKIGNPKHSKPIKPYGHLQQNQKDLYDALNEAIQMQPKRPGERSPVKGFSELSSIVIQPNEQSIDHSVDDLLVNSEGNKNKRDSVKVQQELQPATMASPNFHLNIMYLMGENQSNRNTSTKNSLPPSKSMERSNNYHPKEVARTKAPKSVNNLDPEHASPSKQSNLFVQRVVSGPYSNQMKQMPVGQQRIKDSSVPLQSSRDENSQQKTLYYLNFKREDPLRTGAVGSYFNVSMKNQTMEPEGGLTLDNGTQIQAKHLRSSSLHPEDILTVKRSFGLMADELIFQQKSQEVDQQKKSSNDIRSLDAARGLVRAFRAKLSSLAFAMDNNQMDENSVKEICSLIEDYNENKYLLSNKDHDMLAKLEATLSTISNSEAMKSLNEEPQYNQTQKPPRSVSVNVITKHISTSIKDLESKQQDDSPYKPYKKSLDYNVFNDSVSSGRGSNHDDKTTTTNSSLGGTKELSLLYSKGKGNWTQTTGKVPVNQGGNTINIYNQFAIQDLKQLRASKEHFASPKNPSEGEWLHPRRSLQGESSETASKGKATQEVQSLIEKQKKNLEDFDKIKKEFGSKNFVLGTLDAYNGNKPSYNEIRQDKTEREATKNIYENHEGF